MPTCDSDLRRVPPDDEQFHPPLKFGELASERVVDLQLDKLAMGDAESPEDCARPWSQTRDFAP
jgi:hypothetical protein